MRRSYQNQHHEPLSTRRIFDGVVRGVFDTPKPVHFENKPLVTPPMVRARRQLDAVLLREKEKRGWSYRTSRVARVLFFRRLQIWNRRFMRRLGRFLPDFDGIPPKKALYASLIGGVSFGMVAMSMFQGFTDKNAEAMPVATVAEPASQEVISRELGIENQRYNPDNDIFLQFFTESEKEEYGEQIRSLVAGYPIEDMLPYILEKDRVVAAFLVGIAKKESNWGKRVPVLDGQDCFNYWGYRGVRRLMGTGGHTCFNSRKDAVDTVASRLEKLIHSNKLDTPAKMIIWKCGYSCDGHSRESVRKWIADVDMYFQELQGTDEEDGLVMNPAVTP